MAELCGVLQLPQSTVSRHLKALVDGGWARSRSEGTNHLYRMPPREDPLGRRLWALAREQTERWPTLKQDRLRLMRLRAERQPAALAFFSGAAGRWDRMRSELYGQAFTQSALLSLLPPDWVVADLGCGSGLVAAALAPFVRSVVGVDQSAAMLKAARKRTAALRNVELRQGSLESLPLESRSVDGALLLLSLTYLSDPSRAAAEAAGRPGGRLVVVDCCGDREIPAPRGQVSLGFEPEDWRAC